jgi:ATP-dependent DNA helicase RecQ
VSWEGVDHDLFEALRVLRRDLAAEKQVPPYVVFGDATLREMARHRPGSPEAMRRLYGVGETKLRDYGEAFLRVIAAHCEEKGLTLDAAVKAPVQAEPPMPLKRPARQEEVSAFFRAGLSVEEVMQRTGLARSTVNEYLAAYVRQDRPASIAAWVDEATYHRVADAARQVGVERLKPIFLALNETVPYETIRLVVSHLAPAP